MASGQGELLKFDDWKKCQKSDFCKWNGPGKVCKWIHHDMQNGTLGVFSKDNIVVQSIQSMKSCISSYDITNRGTKQFAFADTSKKIEIAFGIAFEN